MITYYLVCQRDTWDGTNKTLVKSTKSKRAAEAARKRVGKRMESIAYIEVWIQSDLFEEDDHADTE